MMRSIYKVILAGFYLILIGTKECQAQFDLTLSSSLTSTTLGMGEVKTITLIISNSATSTTVVTGVQLKIYLPSTVDPSGTTVSRFDPLTRTVLFSSITVPIGGVRTISFDIVGNSTSSGTIYGELCNYIGKSSGAVIRDTSSDGCNRGVNSPKEDDEIQIDINPTYRTHYLVLGMNQITGNKLTQGDTASFQISARNLNTLPTDIDVDGLSIKCYLPDNITPSNISDNGTYDPISKTITWRNISIAIGGVKNVTFLATSTYTAKSRIYAELCDYNGKNSTSNIKRDLFSNPCNLQFGSINEGDETSIVVVPNNLFDISLSVPSTYTSIEISPNQVKKVIILFKLDTSSNATPGRTIINVTIPKNILVSNIISGGIYDSLQGKISWVTNSILFLGREYVYGFDITALQGFDAPAYILAEICNYNGKSSSFDYRDIDSDPCNMGASIQAEDDEVKILITAAQVIPVTLTDFNASQFGKQVQLTWQVAQEINFKEYQIEKSIDGSLWTQVGVVAAVNQKSYQFFDNALQSSKIYYRLKLVDIDGNFSFSPIRWIMTTDNNLGIWSNRNYINLPPKFKGQRFVLYDLAGKKIQQGIVTGNLLLARVTGSGIYFLRIANQSQKLFLEK